MSSTANFFHQFSLKHWKSWCSILWTAKANISSLQCYSKNTQNSLFAIHYHHNPHCSISALPPYTGLISPSLPPFNPIPIAQRETLQFEIQIEINGIEFIPIYIPHFIVQNYFIVLNRSWVYALKMSIKSILEMVPAFYMMGVHHL